MKSPAIVYGCPYIEVESGWGSRPFGWRLFLTKSSAVRNVKNDSRKGPCSSGYFGPVRPIELYEIPLSCLTKKMKADLKKYKRVCTDDYWSPKFKSFLCDVED